MEFIKRNSNSILICLLELVVGILLLVNPLGFTTTIIMALGIALLIMGVISVVNYFRTDALEASMEGGLMKGLACLLAGAFLVFRPSWLINVFPVLTVLYGVIILVSGLYKVQRFADSLRLKTGRWLFHAINAAVSIICAVIIIANPFSSTVVVWMFIGISLIVEAVLDVVGLIFSRG